MPFINRYTSISHGGIRFVGNTVGLAKRSNLNASGTLGSIGAFTSVSLATAVPTFPNGTTLNIDDNGSSAVLTLPAGATVVYAELVWGGNYRSRAQDISARLSDPVRFTTPAAVTNISPDPVTAQNFTYNSGGLTLGYYMRSAEVTALVAAGGNGTYTTEDVPGLLVPLDADTDQTNHAGWTLAVVYENPAESLGNINLWVGGEIVSPNTPSVDVPITGFITPASGTVSARLFVSAGEGDAVISGDQCRFGPNAGGLINLSGPRNPALNFFASQICDETGQLVTTGTFGDRNANPAAGTNTTACRQGWDITSADGSAVMQNSQTAALFRFTSDGDLYVPNALGMRIDSLGADLVGDKTATPAFVVPGEEVTYTVTFRNNGALPAQTVVVFDDISPGMNFVPGSLTVDGAPQAGGFPVPLSDILPGQTVTLAFRAVASENPPVNPATNVARANYVFFPFPDFPVNETAETPVVTTPIAEVGISLQKSRSRAIAAVGDQIEYTSVLQNDGNLALGSLQFHDPIPVGTAFVTGSVLVDGVPFPAFDPSAGFPLGVLAPGQSHTIQFLVTVLQGAPMIIYNQSNTDFSYTLPDGTVVTGNQPSNIVQTELFSALFTKVKTGDKTFLRAGETSVHTVVLTNNSTLTVQNPFFTDSMTAGASIVPGSVTVNGVSQPSYDPVAGFALADIPPSGVATVTYTIVADNPITAQQVDDFGTVAYTVTDPVSGPRNFTDQTNTVSVIMIVGTIILVKSADRAFAVSGDVIRYTSVATNTGNVTETGLFFRDPIPAGTTFVPGSVTVNGVSQPAADPVTGFALADLAPGQSVTVAFDVSVN